MPIDPGPDPTQAAARTSATQDPVVMRPTRRALLGVVAPTALAFLPWPRLATAAGSPRLGYLSPASGPGDNHAAFLDRLRRLGYEQGKTIDIRWQWAAQRYDRFPDLAADLVKQEPDVLVGQTQA